MPMRQPQLTVRLGVHESTVNARLSLQTMNKGTPTVTALRNTAWCPRKCSRRLILALHTEHTHANAATAARSQLGVHESTTDARLSLQTLSKGTPTVTATRSTAWCRRSCGRRLTLAPNTEQRHSNGNCSSQYSLVSTKVQQALDSRSKH